MKGSASGVTLIEAALAMVFISFLLLMSAGLWDYVKSSAAISDVVANYASRSYTGVFKYNPVHRKYGFDLSAASSEFEGLAREAIDRIKQELADSSESNKRIEFLFVTADIDPVSGEYRGLNYFSDHDSIGYGTLSIPADLRDLDFRAALERYIRQNKAELAIPTHNFGILASNRKFLSEVPLLVTRALYNFGESSVLRRLGILEHTFVWDIKVNVLRGDV